MLPEMHPKIRSMNILSKSFGDVVSKPSTKLSLCSSLFVDELVSLTTDVSRLIYELIAWLVNLLTIEIKF